MADVTYGKGVFWNKVSEGKYNLMATDVVTGVDCRDLPYADGTLACLVLDPPYMERLFRSSEDKLAGAGNYAAFREHYSNGQATSEAPNTMPSFWTCTSGWWTRPTAFCGREGC